MKTFDLYNGDCLDVMKTLPDDSVDMVLADPPYGSTACNWDSIIPLEPLWKELKRITKEKVAIVMMASQPFTTTLISSNTGMFKYCWVWEKNFSTNFLHAKRQPLRKTEDIVVWQKGTSFYYPIKTTGHIPTQSAKGLSNGVLWHGDNVRDYKGGDTTRYPVNILRFKSPDPKNRLHPTQKPVDLMEYLIKTYTTENETVLDFTMGSGTTGVACVRTKRNFIGIELDEKYFGVAKDRIDQESTNLESLFA